MHNTFFYSHTKPVAVLLLLTTLSGCAYAPPVLPNVQARDFYTFQTKQEDVTAAVKPMPLAGDTEMSFGANLTKKKILPIEIILFNESGEALDLSGATVRVSDLADRAVTLLSWEEVFKRTHRSTATRTFAGAVAGSLFLFFTIPVAFITWKDSRKANVAMRRVLAESGRAPAKILPGERGRWFVYADLGSIPAPEVGSKESVDFFLDLTGVTSERSGRALAFSVSFYD